MPHFLFAILIYAAPIALLMTPFMLISWFYKKDTKTKNESIKKPDFNQLEQQLTKLIETNNFINQSEVLQQTLEQTTTNIISSYLRPKKKHLKGFHLFTLIICLIKNNADDKKIIKLMRRYFPSSSTVHLYTLLRSYKEFLNMLQTDAQKKQLIKALNQNNLKPILIWLENNLQQILKNIPKTPTALKPLLVEKAVTIGLILAAFCEIEQPDATEKILRLCAMLSPDIFTSWHQVKNNNEEVMYYIRDNKKDFNLYQ